jgi:CspA family cold shock protein
MATQLDRIERMLAALCDHLGVHDVNTSVSNAARDLAAENGHRYRGVVSKFEHGWGFIECKELSRNFFVHYSDVEGTGLRVLEAGEEVSFEIGPGKDGRPKAVRVQRERSGQSLPEQPRMEVASQETAADDGSLTRAEEAIDQDEKSEPGPSEVRPSRITVRRTSTRRARLGALPRKRPAISW